MRRARQDPRLLKYEINDTFVRIGVKESVRAAFVGAHGHRFWLKIRAFPILMCFWRSFYPILSYPQTPTPA